LNILFLIATPNIYGGTPKKLLDMVKHSRNRCVVYFWSEAYNEKNALFQEAGAETYTGNYGQNIFKHVRSIIKIVDKHSIDIIQTQFSFGETLGYFVKLLRPKVKLIVAFVGPLNPPLIKRIILNRFYKRVDAFIYISEYVKKEKKTVFPVLKKRPGRVIYNGTSLLPHSTKAAQFTDHFKILAVSGLVDWKNIETLIRAVGIIVHDMNYPRIELTVIGDGPERVNLEHLIADLKLKEYVALLGYREDVGDFLRTSNLFVHPSVAEGFGIAVAEAMMAGLPVIAANAGALPELIVDGESGLLVASCDAEKWAEVIVKLMKDPALARKLADNGKRRAFEFFSIERFVSNYETMYEDVFNGRLI